MKKSINLYELSRTEKLAFLEKLASKKFKLKPSSDQEIQSELWFDRIAFDQYFCRENGEVWTREKIEATESDCILIVDLIGSNGSGDQECFQIIPIHNNGLENLLVQK